MNTKLDNAERIFEGKLDAPENVQIRDDAIYASLRTNQIVKVTNETIEPLTSFGESCCEFLQSLSFDFWLIQLFGRHRQ